MPNFADSIYDWNGNQPWKKGVGQGYFSLLSPQQQAQQAFDARAAEANLRAGQEGDLQYGRQRSIHDADQAQQQYQFDQTMGLKYGQLGSENYTQRQREAIQREHLGEEARQFNQNTDFRYRQAGEQAYQSDVGNFQHQQQFREGQHQFDVNKDQQERARLQQAYEYEKSGNTQAYQYDQRQQHEDAARREGYDQQYGMAQFHAQQASYDAQQHAQLQDWQKNQDLSRDEQKYLNQLNNARGSVAANPDLSDGEKNALLTQIMHKVNPLEERAKMSQMRAQTQYQEAHAQAQQQQNAVQTSMMQMDGAAWNEHFQKHSFQLPDGTTVYVDPQGKFGHISPAKAERHPTEDPKYKADWMRQYMKDYEGASPERAAKAFTEFHKHVGDQRDSIGPVGQPAGIASDSIGPVAQPATPYAPDDLFKLKKDQPKWEPKKAENDAIAYAQDSYPEAHKAVEGGKNHKEADKYKLSKQSYFRNREPDEVKLTAGGATGAEGPTISKDQFTRDLNERAALYKAFGEQSNMTDEARQRVISLGARVARYTAQHPELAQHAKPAAPMPTTMPEIDAKLDKFNAKIAEAEKRDAANRADKYIENTKRFGGRFEGGKQ